MSNLWNRIRRLSTGIMLLAACAFAFHTGAVAATFGAANDCLGHASSAEQAAPDFHMHSGADAHIPQADAGEKHASHKDHGHCKVPCCGTGCTTAVLAYGIVLATARAQSTRAALPTVTALSGTDTKGLKRPPRPLPLS